MDKQLKLASEVQLDSIVDGPGIRAVIWTQGCLHKCPNCHNPQTHNLDDGKYYSISAILSKIYANPLQSGVTISGGDPLLQVERLLPLVKDLKEHQKNIWIYTGYLYEDLIDIKNPQQKYFIELFKYVDVLVDGPFIQDLHNPLLSFRGSSNQRLIDIQATNKYQEIRLYKTE